MPESTPRNVPRTSQDCNPTLVGYREGVLALYLAAPDTPSRARPSDIALAEVFFRRGFPLRDVAHAIRLSILRRTKRDPGLEPLEPIRSLAYFRPQVEQLLRSPHDPGYVEYIEWSYRDLLADGAPDSGEPLASRGL